MRQHLLLLFVIGLAETEAITNCPVNSFNLPAADTSQLTWYPNNFTGTEPPVFADHYTCTYTINVPVGWSVTIRLTVKQDSISDGAPAPVIVTDQYQYSDDVYATIDEQFFFLAGGGIIQLITNELLGVRFGFSILWTQNPATFNPTTDRVQISDTQPKFHSTSVAGATWQVLAETRVSLVVTAPDNQDLAYYLGSLIVYDGPDWNSKVIGSAYTVWKSKKQLVSTGQFMSIRGLSYFGAGTYLVFQDYENTKTIQEYQCLKCRSSECWGSPLVMSGGAQGIAAVSTVTQDGQPDVEYLMGLSGQGTLEVFIGGMTSSKKNLIATYNLNDTTTTSHLLPQQFHGNLVTYVLNGANARVNITRYPQYFFQDAEIGRSGFLTSNYYLADDTKKSHNMYDVITAKDGQLLKYSFNIRDVDLDGKTELNIIVSKPGLTTYNETFTASNRPNLNQWIQADGNSFSVEYNTFSQKTNGFYIGFEFLKPDNSSMRSVLYFVFIFVNLLIFV